MAQFKTKADKSFETKLASLTAPVGYIHDIGNDWSKFGDDFEIPVVQHRIADFDRDAVQKLFYQYGSYLELIDTDLPLTTGEVRERLDAQ